jgi:hypothetical protein
MPSKVLYLKPSWCPLPFAIAVSSFKFHPYASSAFQFLALYTTADTLPAIFFQQNICFLKYIEQASLLMAFKSHPQLN